jgi:hypothetical protein
MLNKIRLPKKKKKKRKKKRRRIEEVLLKSLLGTYYKLLSNPGKGRG